MSEKKGRISVLIPCYNHEKFVADCLNSILQQSYNDYEVILCDDCSKDASVAVVRQQIPKFEEQGIRFVLLENQQNQGITRNLNRMLKEAQGEYIKIIASDDMLVDTYMEEMVSALAENPQWQFVFSNGRKIREAASYPVQEEYLMDALVNGIPDCENQSLERIYTHNFVPAPTLLFRRSVLLEVGGYDESIGIEDLEMLLRVLARYPSGMGYCEKQLVYYRINENSITSMHNNAGVRRRIRFMYENSVAITKKYRSQVSRNIYRKRMWELRKEYVIKQLIILLKG